MNIFLCHICNMMKRVLKIFFALVFLFISDQDLYSSFYSENEDYQECKEYISVYHHNHEYPIVEKSKTSLLPNNFFIAYYYHTKVQKVYDSLFSFFPVKEKNELSIADYEINDNKDFFSDISEKKSIMGIGVFTASQLSDFLLSNNSAVDSVESLNLAKLYVSESKIEGINHDIAFIQMCHETGFLRYDGVVDKKQNNFCGLGTINEDTPGESFKTKKEGVRAHIQHLKAYASQHDLKQEVVDKRFRFVQRGVAPHVEDLTGRWASDKQYDKKIVKLIQRIDNYFAHKRVKS